MSEQIRLGHKSDGTPYVRLYLGRSPITGKQTRAYREFPGMTDEQATRAATEWRDAMADSHARDSLRVGELLGQYVTRLETQGSSYNTIKTYRLYARRYAAPIARQQVASVTPAMLDELFQDLMRNGPKGGRGLSPSTVKKFREFLRGAFGHYVRLGLITTNPVSDTPPIPAPMDEAHEAHALDNDDLEKLMGWIAATIAHDPDDNPGIVSRNAAMAMLIALSTGARVGEVAALRRRDLTTGAGGIVRSVRIGGNVGERDGKAVRQDRTKGKRTRVVAIDADTSKALRAHMRWQDGYLASHGKDTPICTPDGAHMAPSALSYRYARVRRQLGIDPATTFHSLRHTHATMLLQGGENMRVVQERLGHAQVATTLSTYAHVLSGRDQQAANAFGALIWGG